MATALVSGTTTVPGCEGGPDGTPAASSPFPSPGLLPPPSADGEMALALCRVPHKEWSPTPPSESPLIAPHKPWSREARGCAWRTSQVPDDWCSLARRGVCRAGCSCAACATAIHG